MQAFHILQGWNRWIGANHGREGGGQGPESANGLQEVTGVWAGTVPIFLGWRVAGTHGRQAKCRSPTWKRI
jgi:hypothetical protein